MDNSYLPRLLEAKLLRLVQQFPAVAVLGPRKVGKTSLVQAIRNQVGRPSVYLDLERQADLAKLRDMESFVDAHRDQLVILDEIHRQPGLFGELRGAIDRHRRAGRFIFLGSASVELLRGSAESPAGRVAYLDLHGLTYAEVQPAVDYRTLWLRGGFPDSVLAAQLHPCLPRARTAPAWARCRPGHPPPALDDARPRQRPTTQQAETRQRPRPQRAYP